MRNTLRTMVLVTLLAMSATSLVANAPAPQQGPAPMPPTTSLA